MQKYREINGNDYVKDSRVTINETMQSIQSMNSGTAFPTTNLFEGMKCYRTDLKKTYTLTDAENGTWVEDAHATLADTATKLQTPRTLSLTGKAAGSATFDGSANAAINVTSVNADTASKLSTARKINITGNATGAAAFDGSGDISINTTVNESKHAAAATTVNATAPNGGAADLAFGTMAANDYARIRVYGKDDNGALEIATADGGNEPIYARQYSGAYDWPNGRPGTVMNEASILDSNGNTKFPKNVTAASFTGPLNGNATSATTAGNVSGKIYYSSNSPSVATDKLFVVKQAHGGDDNVPNNGIVIQSGPTGANYNGKLYITDNGGDGVWIGGVAAGKEVGWTRLVENKGSWNINSATATKLATPRAISLTGNASGSANFDGSGNVSINTTVSNAKTATTASSVAWSGVTGKPETYPPSAHNHDSAYPSVTGTRASGTWGINISGNAASATNADKLDGHHASDIINRITAANTGGIVAASLTANGYVKFANGLILQWGSHTGGGSWYHHTFPIAFSTVFDVIDGYSSTSTGQFYGYSKNITNTGFDMRIDSSETGRYIAIGI